MSVVSDIFAGGLEGVVKGVTDLIGAFHLSPEQAKEAQIKLEQIRLDAISKVGDQEASIIGAINQTMQGEAKSEHFMQYAWRPCIGFTAATLIVNNYVLLPYFQKVGLLAIVIPDPLWYFMMAVLGVTAAGRSVEKVMGSFGGGK